MTVGAPAVRAKTDDQTIAAMIGELAALRHENARLRLERDSEGGYANYLEDTLGRQIAMAVERMRAFYHAQP